jgi:hypothetical protein
MVDNGFQTAASLSKRHIIDQSYATDKSCYNATGFVSPFHSVISAKLAASAIVT